MHRPSLVFKKLQLSKNWMESNDGMGTGMAPPIGLPIRILVDMVDGEIVIGVGNVKISMMRKNA